MQFLATATLIPVDLKLSHLRSKCVNTSVCDNLVGFQQSTAVKGDFFIFSQQQTQKGLTTFSLAMTQTTHGSAGSLAEDPFIIGCCGDRRSYPKLLAILGTAKCLL